MLDRRSLAAGVLLMPLFASARGFAAEGDVQGFAVDRNGPPIGRTSCASPATATG